jgi:tetratricopeptide (TPR) repeat protein
MNPTSPHSPSIPKLIAFSVISCALILFLVEGVLAIFDLPEGGSSRDPFIGFSSQGQLFTESIVTENGKKIPVMITHPDKLELFPSQRFTKTKSANVFRALCIGGSTTHGRPYTHRTSFCSWLEDFLNYVDLDHKWEVINAGGISYASYRVALLMEELVQYEPDLVVVYSGHNEFLERRTYSKILKLPEVVRDLGALAAKLRIYSILNNMIGHWMNGRGNPGFVHQLPKEVDPILDQAVGPDDYRRDDEQKKDVVAHFRFNLTRIVKLAQSAHSNVILVTPASKLRNEAPFKSQHRDNFDRSALEEWKKNYELALALVREKKFEAALVPISKAEVLDPRFAHTFALKGDILFALGRYEEAKIAYRRAIDEDVCPLRAITPLRTAVTDIGHKMNVPVVDFDSIISKRSPNGITDEGWFLDHVHPTIEGHKILALEILNTIIKRGVVRSHRPMPKEGIRLIEESKMSQVDREAQADALMKLAMLANWGGKFREAMTLARRAIDLDTELVHDRYQFKWVFSYNVSENLGETYTALGNDIEAKVRYLLAIKDGVDASIYNTKKRVEILPKSRQEIVENAMD